MIFARENCFFVKSGVIQIYPSEIGVIAGATIAFAIKHDFTANRKLLSVLSGFEVSLVKDSHATGVKPPKN
jgi:hypothetical protein